MAQKTKVTENKWKAIKILLESGAKYTEINETMGVSNTVISFCKQSETYEEFRHKLYVTSGAYRRKMAAEAKAKQEAQEKAKQEKGKKVAEVAKEVGAVTASELVKDEQKSTQDRQTIVVQASHYMLEEQKKTNELLTAISNKLAMIITDLYGVNK